MRRWMVCLMFWSLPWSVLGAGVRSYEGATIIDGNGGPPIADGVILVEGDRIRAVGPRRQVAIPADAERIDVRGKYIVPGLMDANVHLVPWPSWTYIEFLARYETTSRASRLKPHRSH